MIIPLDERAARALASEGPANAERIHPSWLAGAPPPAWLPDDVRRWHERGRLGGLADMPAGETRTVARAEDLARLPVALLRRLVETIGRRQLALVVQAAPQGAARLLSAQLGADAPVFLGEVAKKALKDEIGLAVRRLASAARKPPILFRAGAAWIAPWLAAHGADWMVAQRLPRELGALLVDAAPDPLDVSAELQRHVQAILDAAPT